MNKLCKSMKNSEMKGLYSNEIRKVLSPDEVMNFSSYVKSRKDKIAYNKIFSTLVKKTIIKGDTLDNERILEIFSKIFPRITLKESSEKYCTKSKLLFSEIVETYLRLAPKCLEYLRGMSVGVTLNEEDSPIICCPDLIGEDIVYVITTQQWKSTGTNLVKKLLVDYCVAVECGREVSSVGIFYSDVGEMKKYNLGNWDYKPFFKYVCSCVPCDEVALIGNNQSKTSYLISVRLARLDYSFETVIHRTSDWRLPEVFGKFSIEKDIGILLEGTDNAKDLAFIEHFIEIIKDIRYFSISVDGMMVGGEINPRDVSGLSAESLPCFDMSPTAIICNEKIVDVVLCRKHGNLSNEYMYVSSNLNITIPLEDKDAALSSFSNWQDGGFSGVIFDIIVVTEEDFINLVNNLVLIRSHIGQSNSFDILLRVPDRTDIPYITLEELLDDLTKSKPSVSFKLCLDAENTLSHGKYPPHYVYDLTRYPFEIGLVNVHLSNPSANELFLFCEDNRLPIAFKGNKY